TVCENPVCRENAMQYLAAPFRGMNCHERGLFHSLDMSTLANLSFAGQFLRFDESFSVFSRSPQSKPLQAREMQTRHG
ncbi:MAG: hypothetical protein JWM11_1785, partial [Planctomycetaceae bacterium]|nr:hypothetical protein [Planctomycetaceae bacterium]